MWTHKLRPLILKMSQMRSGARCFEYGEHILLHARHPPQDQGEEGQRGDMPSRWLESEKVATKCILDIEVTRYLIKSIW